MCVVSTEVAFSDLERFCSKAPQSLISIMTVDPTFTFGEFYFTPITFKNLAVHWKLTGQPKIDMGPALIHQRKFFSSHHYFSSSLVQGWVNWNVLGLMESITWLLLLQKVFHLWVSWDALYILKEMSRKGWIHYQLVRKIWSFKISLGN